MHPKKLDRHHTIPESAVLWHLACKICTATTNTPGWEDTHHWLKNLHVALPDVRPCN